MVKTKSIFVCQQCGAQAPKWMGQCGECGQWNSLVEEAALTTPKQLQGLGYAGVKRAEVTLLEAVAVTDVARAKTGLKELDRVLGGGLVAGSAVLIGGDPGIGKSTLLLQTLCAQSEAQTCLYVTGEESLQQVAMRAQRLNCPTAHLRLVAETHVERIIDIVSEQQPKVLVVDSIQTMFTDSLSAAPGAVSQVRESAARLVRFAKQYGVALFLVGHVTKEGALAGPRVLEHMVDTVLYFEGDTDSRFRVLRAIKNRFGAVNELGIFAMTEHGLKEVNNPSAIFLNRSELAVAGSSVMVTWEGSRPILVEVQALVDQSHLGNPRRVCVGLEHNRLAMLLAVLHRHGGIATYDQDVFVNVVGGVKVTETAADLALLAAIVSSLRNQPLARDMVLFGEVGLAGEIRPVQRGGERLQEALKHGFQRAIVPKQNAPKSLPEMAVQGVQQLRQVLEALF